MLTKETVIDKIEILEQGHIQVRRATYILEDGVRIAGPIYHRDSAMAPGDDTQAAAKVIRDVAAVVWTPEVIQTHQDRKVAEPPVNREQ